MATEVKKTTRAKKPRAADSAKKDAALTAPVYSMRGEQVSTVTLPPQIFGLKWNPDLVHQVVVSMQANARQPWAHTKTRGEVRGGGKKPWRQKGTGRARHGSRRSPIWVGGGITHGPRNEKDYSRKINQKMRQKALLVALSRKFRDGEVIFVNSIAIEVPKARDAKAFLFSMEGAGFAMKKKNAALLSLPSANRAAAKSFQNFGNIETSIVADLNPLAVLSSKYLIVADPEASLAVLGAKRVVKS